MTAAHVPDDERWGSATYRFPRLTQPESSGWVPPAPLRITDFQWELNCARANIGKNELPVWPWLHQGRAS